MKHKLTDETKIYMKKFTFKTEQPTGRYRSFYAPYHIIKCNKKEVGSIESNSLQDEFKIQLRVMKKDIMEDNNPNCKWKNIRFKKVFSSLQEAKDWLNNEETLKVLHSKFTLAVDED